MKVLFNFFVFWSILRLILQGKMTTLKNAQRQPLNFNFFEIFFSEAPLNIKRNNLKGGP